MAQDSAYCINYYCTAKPNWFSVFSLPIICRTKQLPSNCLRFIFIAAAEARINALKVQDAPDEELMILVEKSVAEKLSATEIKKSISSWKGDYRRV